MTDWDDPQPAAAPAMPTAPAAPDAGWGEPGWSEPGWSDDISAAAAAPDAGGDERLRLEPTPDARALRDALLAAGSAPSVRIDASQVERLPGPAMQTLLALARDAAAEGGRITVLDPSFAFSLAFEAFGLGGDNEPFNVEYS
jgi:anti-anti-sigma regulatory factor